MAGIWGELRGRGIRRYFFFFSSRRRHTRFDCDWSSDVCSSDLSIGSDTPTYAHYLRAAGYETTLAGKMHFIGDQLHGYENRLTPDIYPADYGWAVNWDEPERRLEWYHNSSSILQAGPCVRSNQLDYDEEVLYKSKQYLYD